MKRLNRTIHLSSLLTLSLILLAGCGSETDPSIAQKQNQQDSSASSKSKISTSSHSDKDTHGSGLEVEKVQSSNLLAVINDSQAINLASLFPYGDWSCKSGKENCEYTRIKGDVYYGSLRYTCDLYNEMDKGDRGGTCGDPDSFGEWRAYAQDLPHVQYTFKYELQVSQGTIRLIPVMNESQPDMYTKSFLTHHNIPVDKWTELKIQSVELARDEAKSQMDSRDTKNRDSRNESGMSIRDNAHIDMQERMRTYRTSSFELIAMLDSDSTGFVMEDLFSPPGKWWFINTKDELDLINSSKDTTLSRPLLRYHCYSDLYEYPNCGKPESVGFTEGDELEDAVEKPDVYVFFRYELSSDGSTLKVWFDSKNPLNSEYAKEYAMHHGFNAEDTISVEMADLSDQLEER